MTPKRRPLTKARRALLTASVLSLCICSLMLWAPAFGLQLVEAVVPAGSYEMLLLVAAVSVAVMLVAGVMDYCRHVVLLRAGLWLERSLGGLVLERGISDGVEESTFHTRARAITDMRASLSSGILGAILELPWTVAACAAIAILHPGLGLACGAILFVAVLAHVALGALALPAPSPAADAERWRAIGARAAGELGAGGLSAAVARNWDLANRRWIASFYRSGVRKGLAAASARMIAATGLLAVMAIAAHLAIADGLSLGVAVAAVLLMARALALFEQSISNWQQIRTLRAAWSVLAALDVDDVQGGAAGAPLWSGPGRIVLDCVSSAYPGGERPALRDVSLVIAPGDCIGLWGRAGSGKSALAAVIAGRLVPRTGQAKIDGEPIQLRQRSSSRPPIGYLSDTPLLLPGSVRENIAGFEAASDAAVIQAACAAGVHEMLQALPRAYETQVGENGCLLSLRQRRAVALARALFGERRLVVLDQPELGLDEDGLARLIGALWALRRAGLGLVIATGDARLLELTDRIVVLESGMIDRVGPRQGIIDRLHEPARYAA
jgi:ABC-type protease/lipase transport system fused ATPase/permease subunit